MKRNCRQLNQLYVKLVKYIHKLKRLQLSGLNTHRQGVLKRHIIKIDRKLRALQLTNKKVAATMAYALLLCGGSVVAQADYATPQISPFNLNGLNYRKTPSLVDIDDDGDLDMLYSQNGQSVLFYENIGTLDTPLFTTGVGIGISLGVGVPAPYDFDDDGDFDLIWLAANENFYYSENIGSATNFNFDDPQLNPFNLSVSLLPTPNYIYADITPLVGDIDADGDLDLFIQNFYFNNFVFFENTGNATTPNFEDPVINPFGVLTSYAQFGLGDFDMDGDFDLLGTTFDGGNFFLQENIGTPENPEFAGNLQLNPFNLPTEYNTFTVPFPVDFDDDGDLDIMISEYFSGYGGGIEGDVIVYIENKEFDDSCGEIEFVGPLFNQFGINNFSNTEVNQSFGDLDGDGDLDMLISLYYFEHSMQYQENIGSATNPIFDQPQVDPFGITTPLGEDFYIRHIELVDLDGDGDLDIMVGSRNLDETFKYYENFGDSQNPAFSTITIDPFNLGYPDSLSQDFSFADLDNDGDLDLLSGESFNGNNDINYFENIGTATAPMFDTRIINPFGLAAVGLGPAPEFIDMDADGDFDVLMGNQSGNFYYVVNIGSAESPNFTTPVLNPFGFSNVGNFSSPTVVDIDGDGDEDVFSKSGTPTLYSDGWRFFENATEAEDFTITGGDFTVSAEEDGTVIIDPLEVLVLGNCVNSGDVTSATVSPNSFDCDDVGSIITITITYVIDGVTYTVTSNVTIIDAFAPLVEDLPDLTLLAAPGENTIEIPDYTIGVNVADNCDTFPPPNPPPAPFSNVGTITQLPAPGTVLPINNTAQVVISATDASNNVGTTDFTVTIEQTVNGGDFELSVNETGTLTIDPLDLLILGDSVSLDDLTSVTASHSQFDCDDVGITTVVTVDFMYNGEMESVTSNLLITDTIAPQLDPMEDVTLTAAQGETTALLPDYTVLANAVDNCATFPVPNPPPAPFSGSGDFTQQPEPGSVHDVGDIVQVEITATDASGNQDSIMFNVTVEPSLGLDESILATQLKLVPNPATYSVALVHDGAIHFTEIAIIDLLGKKVKTFTNLSNENANTLSLAGIPAGFYLLQVQAGNDTITKKLIIK